MAGLAPATHAGESGGTAAVWVAASCPAMTSFAWTRQESPNA